MNTHYNIFKTTPENNSITTMGSVYHYDEIQPSIDSFKIVHPDCQFYYEVITTSDVKSGFGRDPDLH